MIDPKLLVTLEAVARNGSFAAAADELCCTQSAVSQQIAEIERQAGIRVLDRRPVRVTEAGQILLEAELAVRTAAAIAMHGLEALREGRTGSVRLAAFDSAALAIVPKALADFSRTHPTVQVGLFQLEAEESYTRILRGSIDLAITFDYKGAQTAPPSGVRRTLLAEDPVLAVLPFDHPAAKRKVVRLADLANDAWIGTPVTELHKDLLASLNPLGARGAFLQFDGDNFQTILGLVEQGLGVTLLPRLATLRSPSNVVMKPLMEAPLTRFVYLARLDSRHAPPVLSDFEQQLSEIARKILGTRH